jgi:hypothetical protein
MVTVKLVYQSAAYTFANGDFAVDLCVLTVVGGSCWCHGNHECLSPVAGSSN